MKHMNSVELKSHLLKMMEDYFSNPFNKILNVHACFWMAIIDAIMAQYMSRTDYMEEDAIATMQGFINHGVINW